MCIVQIRTVQDVHVVQGHSVSKLKSTLQQRVSTYIVYSIYLPKWQIPPAVHCNFSPRREVEVFRIFNIFNWNLYMSKMLKECTNEKHLL